MSADSPQSTGSGTGTAGSAEQAERAGQAEQARYPASERPLGDPERARTYLGRMILLRRFEERCVELYQATKIRGFLHVYVGEEAVATGVLDALREDDAVVATYREHGHALLKGMTARSVMAEMYGRVTGCSRGRGGSMHLFDAETSFCGGNAIVGGGLPLAIGMGLADQMQHRDRVTVCFFGEGAMAEGEFHESMNLAALWRLPVLFLCENNLYAMGTALARSESETNLALKAASYEVPSWSVDGMDVLEVADAAARAVDAIRSGGGPHFLEARTYRFRAHSMFDPERYRDKAEVEQWRQRDPIEQLRNALREAGELTDEQVSEMERSAAAEIDDAVAYAESEADEDVAELERFVYSDDSSVWRHGTPWAVQARERKGAQR